MYIMLGLIQLTTLFLFSDHFQSSVQLLKEVDKYIIKLVTLVNVVYQANHELINGQYVIYYAYLFCKVVYDGFFRCNCMYTKIFGTNFTCYAKKDSH